MRLLVTGNRDWTDRERIRDVLVTFQRENRLDPLWITMIHGGEGRRRSNGKAWRGADLIASDVAFELGWHVIEVPAQWYLHPKAAGPIRNRRMVSEFRPTQGIAFGDLERDGKQTGTGDCVRVMEKAGIRVKRVEWRNR